MAEWRPWPARVALIGWVVVAALFVAITFSPLKSGYAEKARFDAPGDVALYNAEIRRMRAGQPYYDAAAVELRARGYPTRSFFNWRTPWPMAIVAALPHPRAGQVLLASLAVLLLLGGLFWLAREASPWEALGGALLGFGAVMPCFLGDLYVMPELWSGILIGLSVCAHGAGRPRVAACLGTCALLCRELAAPYVVVAAGLCWYQGRRGALALWGLGLAGYAIFLAWHAAQVANRIGPHDIAHPQGWIQFGAAPFVISVVQMSCYLLVTPQWVSALYLAAAMLGLAGWNSSGGRLAALTVCAYVVLFSVLGQSFNQYWGLLFAPLLCWGVARFPKSLGELYRAARPAASGAGVAGCDAPAAQCQRQG